MQIFNSIADLLSCWDDLGLDVIELILSRLPIPSILRAASVCKRWHSIVHSESFKNLESDSRRQPWFFLSDDNSRVFAFDPASDGWIRLPGTILPCSHTFVASNGFFFTTCSGKFSFKHQNSLQTSSVPFSRHNPLTGVYKEPDSPKPVRFIVAGGIRPVGAILVDDDDCLAVEIYDPNCDSWEIRPPLPEIFKPGNTIQALCSALCNRKFYVLSTCQGFISSFDLDNRCWSPVGTVKPPGAQFTSLISCQDHLVLAGLCSFHGNLEFNLWRFDEVTLEFNEIGIMPPELLSMFITNKLDYIFDNVKCCGSGNLVYMFNASNGRTCLCEIGGPGKCNWRWVPCLPWPVDKFQGVSTFCSTFCLEDSPAQPKTVDK